MQKAAKLSACGRYRYALSRIWDANLGYAMFVGLNPSKADAVNDDPTLRRCMAFAEAWRYGAVCMANLFAFRATKPADMMAAPDPIGPDNDRYLRKMAEEARVVIACWGVHGRHLGRDRQVREMLPNMHYLRLTKRGYPSHPLHPPKDLKPTAWQMRSCDA
jgi:hypothetical protein